jgi:hypothetical protein
MVPTALLRAGGLRDIHYDIEVQANSDRVAYSNERYVFCHPKVPSVKGQISVDLPKASVVAIESHFQGNVLGDSTQCEIPEHLELIRIGRRDYFAGDERNRWVLLRIGEILAFDHFILRTVPRCHACSRDLHAQGSALRNTGVATLNSPVQELNAIRKKLPATLSRSDLEMVALDYFERLEHDNHRRLCRVYGWEEKKTKASWGGSTVDYRDHCGHRCARNEDAGSPALPDRMRACVRPVLSGIRSPAGAWEGLQSRSAIRYKIDTAKLAAEVRTEFSKREKAGKNPPKPAASSLRK